MPATIRRTAPTVDVNPFVTCSFISAAGPPQDLKERLTVWQLPGLDGYGAQRVGRGDAPFRFTAVHHGTEAQINTFITAMQALQGEIVEVKDDWNITHAKLLVTAVGQPIKHPAYNGANTTRGEVTFSGVTHS